MQKPRHMAEVLAFGTPETIRTSDARFRKPTLYPLSYGSMLLGLLHGMN